MFGPTPWMLMVLEGIVNVMPWLLNLWRIFVVVIILCVSVCGLAYGAEPKDVQKAIAIVKTKGTISADAFDDMNGEAVPVSIWSYVPPKCGGEMSVQQATIGPGVTVRAITVAVNVKHPTDSVVTYMVSDTNADGIVDDVQLDRRVSRPVAQVLLDLMVKCVASQK